MDGCAILHHHPRSHEKPITFVAIYRGVESFRWVSQVPVLLMFFSPGVISNRKSGKSASFLHWAKKISRSCAVKTSPDPWESSQTHGQCEKEQGNQNTHGVAAVANSAPLLKVNNLWFNTENSLVGKKCMDGLLAIVG